MPKFRRCGDKRVVGRSKSIDAQVIASAPLTSRQKSCGSNSINPICIGRQKKFLCAKDFIAFKLTGRCATDYADASGSNLFDLRQRAWSADLIDASGLDVATLPDMHASIDILGEVTREASEATGLKPGTPVVIGGGDGARAIG